MAQTTLAIATVEISGLPIKTMLQLWACRLQLYSLGLLWEKPKELAENLASNTATAQTVQMA